MTLQQNSKGSSLFQILKQSCLRLLGGPLKVSSFPPVQLSHEPSRSSTVPSPKIIKNKLEKPNILSETIKLEYREDFQTWENVITPDHLIGILGNPNYTDLKLPQNSQEISITPRSEINSLAHLRDHCFDFIFSITWEKNLLEKIFDSKQGVTIKITSDDDLRTLVTLWEHIIKEQCQRKHILLKKIVEKLVLKARIVNGNYWVTLGQKDTQLLDKQINALGIQSTDSLLFQRMKRGLMVREYWELVKLQKKQSQKFTREVVVGFLLSINLLTDDQVTVRSSVLSPSISFYPSITNTSPINEFQINQDLKSVKVVSEASKSEEQVFFFHLMDRYEGIQGDDDRGLHVPSQPIRQRKQRTRSCCVDVPHNVEIDHNIFDQDSDY